MSCVWLLENLHKINSGIIQSQTHFEKKEIKIVFNPSLISLKQVVQLLAFVGYEPMIHLGGNDWLKKKKVNKKQLYKIKWQIRIIYEVYKTKNNTIEKFIRC